MFAALRPTLLGANSYRSSVILIAMKLILKWLLGACALLTLSHLLTTISVASFADALWAALVIGLLNTFIRPVLIVLTLPVTMLTVGLFLFVINALLFWSAGRLLEGFEVAGFVPALIGSLVYSLTLIVIDYALEVMFRLNKQQ
jgi:putative membrane protein